VRLPHLPLKTELRCNGKEGAGLSKRWALIAVPALVLTTALGGCGGNEQSNLRERDRRDAGSVDPGDANGQGGH